MKNIQIPNFKKIRSVGAEFHHADRTIRRRDMTELIVAFRSSANAPKKRIDQWSSEMLSLFMCDPHETQKYSLGETFIPFVVTTKNLKLQKCAYYFLSVAKFKFVFSLTNNNSWPH